MYNKLKKILEYLGLYMSMLGRRKEDIMVFGSWFGQKYADNPKYLYEIALAKGYKAYWITKNENIYKYLKENKYPVFMANSVDGIKVCLQAKYVFYCTSVTDVVSWAIGGANIINLWHGVVLKKFFKDDIHSDYYKKKIHIGEILEEIPYKRRIMLCTSQCEKEIFKRAFGLSENQVKIWGQPRTDTFFNNNNTLLQNEFCEKKIVLYMPTHRNGGKKKLDCESIFDLVSLNNVCKKYEAVFLIKKHYYHKNEETDCSKFSNIYDITNREIDSQELLKSADILVSDYSSAYLDYMLLKRPIVFFNFDSENYLKNDRDMYFDYEKVTPGKKVKSYQQFEAELINIFNGKWEITREYEENLNTFFDKRIRKEVGESILDKVQQIRGKEWEN